MEKHDEETERYLREFQPRAIRGLESDSPSRNFRLRGLAAAAAIAVAVGISLWYGHREMRGVKEEMVSRPFQLPIVKWPRNRNTVVLTRLAMEDNEAFEEFLTWESRRVLPNFQGDPSALRVLTKE